METYRSTKEILLDTKVPISTRTYKAVGHAQLINLTLESIHKAGFEVNKELYTSAKEGKVANGRYTIKSVKDSEMELQIGWQNSLDKSLSLKFAIGSKIFICSNGCVSGNYGNFKKKHQGEVQEFAPTAIVEYIARAGEVFEQLQKARDNMKGIELDRRVQAELLGRMYIEDQIIQSTQLNIIKNELDSPTFDYKCENSMWELYQHTTFALKDSHPSLWMDNHMKTHDFFTKSSEIIDCTPVLELAL